MDLHIADLTKELFAQFGLAYYHSESLCRGLGIFYSIMSFNGANDITKPRIEEKLSEAEPLTFGLMVEKVNPFLPVGLQARLKVAVEKRNYIAHYFWYEQAYMMFGESGLTKLIDELKHYGQLFDELDDEVLELLTQRRLEIGVTDDLIDDQLKRGLAGEVEPSLPSKPRITKKLLRIMQAYDISLEGKIAAIVFETDDGQFVQFCDVGLGWSNFTEVKPNWKINEIIQRYLPASLMPRPVITNPWNYEFRLPQNAILWVKRGQSEKTYRWGIKKAQK